MSTKTESEQIFREHTASLSSELDQGNFPKEFRISDTQLLRYFEASSEFPHVVSDASQEHITRNSPQVFTFSYIEFEGFNFRSMYEQSGVPEEKRIKHSSEQVRILAREPGVLPRSLEKDAKYALSGLIEIAESTRNVSDPDLEQLQAMGIHEKYIRYLEILSSTLPYGSSQDISRQKLESDDDVVADCITTLVPLKGAALCARQALPNIASGCIVPINSTRVPRMNGEFGLGMNLQRDSFRPTVDRLLVGASEGPLRMFEIAIVSGKTTIGFLTLLRSREDVRPSSIEIIAPVVAQQGVENVLQVAEQFKMNVNIVTYEMYHDLDKPDGNDSLRTTDGRLVLGNPPRIAGQIAFDRVHQLEGEFIQAHGLRWLE